MGIMMKRRSSTRLAYQKKKQKQHVSEQNKTAARLTFVVELETSSVSDYLSTADISALLQACASIFSPEYASALTRTAFDRFAKENKTHIGRKCTCDWMRRLDGICHPKNCGQEDPFNMDTSMPILQTPGGTRALLRALGLAEKILKPFCLENSRGETMFAPVVCVLTENEGLFTQEDVTKALNRACKGAGTRFFYDFKMNKAYTRADFIDEHWDGIEGSSCRQCDELPCYQTELWVRARSRMKWKNKAVERIRANCIKVYRPLKAAMKKELQFVRFIPKPHRWSPTDLRGWWRGYRPAGFSAACMSCPDIGHTIDKVLPIGTEAMIGH